MDRAFLEYYEDELAHIRVLAAEFADLHPAVARNLSLDTVPCPDPYVERLLEGVAFLAARTRLKLDGEGCALRPRRARRALSRPRRADARRRHRGAAAGPAGADHARRPRGAARHPAGRRPARRPLDARHLHHRPGRDALAAGDRAPSPITRTGARWPPPASGRSRAAAARRRCGITLAPHRRRAPRRAGARPARPALPQPRQGAGALRHAVRRGRRGRRPRRPAPGSR